MGMICENHWREKNMKFESSSLTPMQSMLRMRTCAAAETGNVLHVAWPILPGSRSVERNSSGLLGRPSERVGTWPGLAHIGTVSCLGIHGAPRMHAACYIVHVVAHILLGDKPWREAAAARFGADVRARRSQHEQAELFAEAQEVLDVPAYSVQHNTSYNVMLRHTTGRGLPAARALSAILG
jgi:hypothetical protein